VNAENIIGNQYKSAMEQVGLELCRVSLLMGLFSRKNTIT